MVICYFSDLTRNHKNDTKQLAEMLKKDDIKSSLLEPLYYTFKTRSQRYKASNFGLLDEVADQVRAMSGEAVIHYVLWTITALLMIVDLLVLRNCLTNVQ